MRKFRVKVKKSGPQNLAGYECEVEDYDEDYYRLSGMDTFLLSKLYCERVNDSSDPFTRMEKMLEEGIVSLNGVIKTLEKLKEEG